MDTLFTDETRSDIIAFINDKIDTHPYRSKGFSRYENDESLFSLYLRIFPEKVYLNNSERSLLVIARVDIDEQFQRKGFFKQILTFLEEVNPHDILLIECVDNLHLREFFPKRGYKTLWRQHRGSPEFYITKDQLRSVS